MIFDTARLAFSVERLRRRFLSPFTGDRRSRAGADVAILTHFSSSTKETK